MLARNNGFQFADQSDSPIVGTGAINDGGKGVDRIISERVSGVEVSRILELPDRLTDPRMTSDYAQIVEDDDIEVVVE